MSFACSCGRLPSAFLEHLGSLGCGGLGCQGAQRGLHDSFPLPSFAFQHPDQSPKLFSQFHQGESTFGRAVCTSSQRGSRTSSSNSGLLQPDVCGPKSLGVLETYNRSLDSQQEREVREVQDGDSSICSSFDQNRGLDGVPGSPGCLPSNPHSSGIEEVPQIHNSGGVVSIQGTLLRSHNSSSSVHSGHGPYFGHYASSRLPDSPLPRRLVDPGLLSSRGSAGKGLSPLALSSTRYSDQLREEQSNSISGGFLSGNEDSDCSFEGFPDSGTVKEIGCTVRGVPLQVSSTGVGLEESFGENVLSFSSGAGLSSSDEISSTQASSVLGFSGRRGFGLVGFSLPQGSSVVVRSRKSDSRGTTEDSPSRPLSLLGRLRPRLGGIGGSESSFRPVVRIRKAKIHQLQGIAGDSSGFGEVSTSSTESFGGSLFGQRYGNQLSKEIGGNSFSNSERVGSGYPQKLRGEQHPPSSPIRLGFSQRHCRFSQSQESDNRIRVDSLESGSSGPDPQVAGQCGSLCHKLEPSASELLFSGQGSYGDRHGRNAPFLGESSGLCLSSFRNDSGGPQQDQGFSQCSVYSNSALLASETMVRGFAGSSDRHSSEVTSEERSTQTASFPSASPEPPVASASCVETIRRSAERPESLRQWLSNLPSPDENLQD